jgi:hypothetical protein
MTSQSGNVPPLSDLAQSGEAAGRVVTPGYAVGDQVAGPLRAGLNPGDELPPGAPGAGENYCLHCDGRGTMPDGGECKNCGGTGKVIESVAGGP